MKTIASILMLTFALVGCHADENDPAGQAEELSDPVRRPGAIANIQRIYSGALADNGGDRSQPAVVAVADAVAEKLNQAYLDNPSDNRNRLAMLEIMSEMRDPRTLPALQEALNWRPEINEEQAVRAGQTLSRMEIPEGQQAEVVAAIAEALRKITQARPVDNRMRIEFLRSLGTIGHPDTEAVLLEIATRLDAAQDFQINRLAGQQLGKVATEASIGPMIKGLFLFPPNNPAMRMNDVASEVLVRIGQPAVAPLLQLLAGENEEANGIAESYIEAVRERNARAAEQMSVEQTIGSEATFALGALGFLDAYEPLIAETQSEDMFRRQNGAVAIVRLNHEESGLARVREVVTGVYESLDNSPEGHQGRAQLIAAMRSLYDPGFISFFLAQAQNTDLHPVARLEAVKAVSLLANRAEADQLNTWIESLDQEGEDNDDPYLQQFRNDSAKAIAMARECDANLACYIGKLGDSDVENARKAAFMVGRLGRGNAEAITALIGQLGNADVEVRLSMVAALDRVATEGSQAAVDRIDELRVEEDGRGIWTQFATEALPIQARLRARGQ